VYQRAKEELDKRSFGTQHDLYKAGIEWINHSIAKGGPRPRTRRSRRCPLVLPRISALDWDLAPVLPT
jgi:hypothetical protein